MALGLYAVDDRPMERLGDAVDELAEIDPADLSDAALADELLALRRQMDRQEATFARFARAAHTRGIGSIDGAASTAAWLRHRAGMREGDAKTAIECGEVCELPETGRAWRAGEIATGAARTIVAARVAGHDDTLVACEPAFLAHARRGDLRGLRQAVAHFRALARSDGTEPGEQDGVFVSKTFGGRTVVSGELSNDAAEQVTTALNAYMDPPSADDPRTTSQRRAAALVRMAEVALAHIDDVNRPRVHVTIVIDWTTLVEDRLGRTDGAFTGPIHRQDIERLLCDSTISRVVTGPDGLPVDVDRASRTPPPSLRRALVARDQGCRYPGCDRPPGWCDAHHIVPWHPRPGSNAAPPGRTDRDNLVLLCDHHHKVIHQPNWKAEFDGHHLQIFRPNGTEVT